MMMTNQIIKRHLIQLEVASKRSMIVAKLHPKNMRMVKLSKRNKMDHHQISQLRRQVLTLMMKNQTIKRPLLHLQLEVGFKRSMIASKLNQRKMKMEKFSKRRKMMISISRLRKQLLLLI